LGLTRREAIVRAIVAASRVNRPAGGDVETVFTCRSQLFLWVRPGPVARRVPVPAASEESRAAPGSSSVRADAASEERPGEQPPSQEPATGPAHLLIDFEHSLKGGVLRVWVDDQPVIDFYHRVARELGKRKMLVVRFDGANEDCATAAFDLDKLAQGDIEFGSNSWRGDHYHDVMRAISPEES